MAGKTYKMRALVLRKTKLGEKDLIVSLLDESGSLVHAVAKGARKPGGSLAARMELFSLVDTVMAKGRNLDVITSAVFAPESPAVTPDIHQASCAAVLSELLCTVAQEDLPNERLFAMSASAFKNMTSSEPDQALAVCAASLLKVYAYAGIRPNFTTCPQCASDVDLDAPAVQTGGVPFSVSEGGAICSQCQVPSDAIRVNPQTLSWCNALMRSRFDDVREFDADNDTLFSVLDLARQWSRFHLGKNLKSLDFLFTSGLY